jgi:two-component system sporulation sensor kinase A/two-component system, sporulation sensor kinase E
MEQWQLIDAERMEAAGELAASIAHAVHNPLAALLGSVELALVEQTPHPLLERVQRMGRRIQTAIDRTLLVFWKGTLSFEEIELKTLVEDICAELEPLARERNVRISTSIDIDAMPIHADRVLLTAAFVHIGENALQAIDGAGELLIEVASLRRVGGVCLQISGNGHGVPRRNRAAAFEPFFTTRGGAAGLSIARGIVQGHEGRIQLEPREGGGTTVSVELPASPAFSIDSLPVEQ